MEKLQNTRCYLAGNLEYAKGNPEEWRDYIKEELSPLGITFLDPTKEMFEGSDSESLEPTKCRKRDRENGNYEKLHEIMKEIVRRDLRAIDLSDFVIFKLHPKNPTYGSTHELIVASQQRKPIFIIVDDIKEFPLWLFGLVKERCIFHNMDEVIDHLTDLNTGKVEMDETYWRLLNYEKR